MKNQFRLSKLALKWAQDEETWPLVWEKIRMGQIIKKDSF